MIKYYLLILLPSMVANGFPPIFSKLFPKFLSTPIDFGLKIHGKRVFGDHKTVRGFLLGTLLAGAIPFLFYNKFMIEYFGVTFGFVTGFSSLCSDAVKSFFKRRIGLSEGTAWFPFDQIDWILGFLFALSFYINMTIYLVIFYLLIGVLIHIFSKIIGYVLKINEKFI